MLYTFMSYPIIVPRKPVCRPFTLGNAAEESLLPTIAVTTVHMTVQVFLPEETF